MEINKEEILISCAKKHNHSLPSSFGGYRWHQYIKDSMEMYANYRIEQFLKDKHSKQDSSDIKENN